jgi:hypothetical protein
MEIRQRDRVFSTPWFEIIAKTVTDNPDPFFDILPR